MHESKIRENKGKGKMTVSIDINDSKKTDRISMATISDIQPTGPLRAAR